MKMLFLGRKELGAQALKWSLETGFEIVGVVTDSHMPDSPTTKLAKQRRLPLLTLEEAGDLTEKGEINFDVAVSFVYWRKIKEPLISHPKQGVINFHPAPLPDYKGLGGYNFAILNAVQSWSVTAHYVDENIDTGRIIERFDFSIDPGEETAFSLEKTSQQFLFALYKKVLRKVLEGRRLATTPNEEGVYYSRSDMEHAKFVKPGDDVDRKIRAFWFPPYSGAKVDVNGKVYTLVNDQILREISRMMAGQS